MVCIIPFDAWIYLVPTKLFVHVYHSLNRLGYIWLHPQEIKITTLSTSANNMKQVTRLLSVLYHLLVLANSKTSINILALVPWPDSRDGAGWDGGIDMLPGGRVAVREINERKDLLADYHINLIEGGHEGCGLTSHSLGLLNIVNNILLPNSSNFVAITGLYCSNSAAALSRIAGRDGLSILQFSSANSPFFHNRSDFPHLWKFLEPAYVYAKMMVHLIRQYKWSNTAIISSQTSLYFDGIATALVDEIRYLNKTVSYYGQLIDLIEEFQDQVLDDLIEARARVVFLSLDRVQITSLLCKAHERNMTHPKYLWIILDKTPGFLLSKSECNERVMLEVLENAVLASYSLAPDDDLIIESSGSSYATFKEKYQNELEKARIDYSNVLEATGITANGDEYAAFLYDEIWALALALNHTQSASNISFGDYTAFKQHDVTAAIEESLRSLDFRGITGNIKFNEYREVSTPIDIYQFLNGSSVVVNRSVVFDMYTDTIALVFDSRFDDVIPVINETQSIHVAVTALAGAGAGLLFIFTTVVFCLLLYYRDKPEIKAISMSASCVMFIGCYLMIAGLILIAVEISMILENSEMRVVLCTFQTVLFLNGLMLIYFMLCLKLFRLYKIFNNKKFKMFGYFYSNISLIVQCLVMISIPDVVLVTLLIVYPIRLQKNILTDETHLQIVNRLYVYCYTSFQSGIFISSLAVFMGIVMIVNVYLASRVKTMDNRDFRNKRTVSILALLIFATYLVLVLINVLALNFGSTVLYRPLVSYFGNYCVVIYCLVLLFIPNLVRSLRQ